MPRERTFKIHHEGEPPTAAIALWVNLTREQVASVERIAGQQSLAKYLQGIAIDAIEGKIDGIGQIRRGVQPDEEA